MTVTWDMTRRFMIYPSSERKLAKLFNLWDLMDDVTNDQTQSPVSLFDGHQKPKKKNHFWKKLDQLGAVLRATLVIAVWRVPFASMMNICRPPFRDDSKEI